MTDAPHARTDIVGRDDELAVGRAFLGVAAHRFASLEIEGPAGVGKSTIWSALVEEAVGRGVTVLACRPAEAEATFTLAAVRDLLERVPQGSGAGLPAPQRAALSAVSTAADPTRPLPEHLVAASVRSLVLALADQGPVLLAVDDVQWLDSSSAAVLGFVARRLTREPVGFLTARRSGTSVPAALGGLSPASSSRLVVGPLSIGALHHVVKARLGQALPRSILARVHAAANGNPLFALEIARVLLEQGPPGVGEPLPVPPDVRLMLEERVRALPDRTRELLLAAAASGRATRARLERALDREIGQDVATAIDSAVLTLGGNGTLAFVHPLLADAVLAGATRGERRAIHGRLAETADDDEERAIHLALTTDEADEETAAALEIAAGRASRRGAPAAAAMMLELAVERTPGDEADAAARRRIALAEAILIMGDVTRAAALLEPLVGTLAPGPRRAEARLLLASILFSTDVQGAAASQALAALEDAASDARLLARTHSVLGRIAPRGREHAVIARRMLETQVDPDPVALTHVYIALADDAVQAGRPIPGDLMERALALEARAPLPAVSDRFSAALATWLKYLDDFEGARTWLRRVHQAALDEGDEHALVFVYAHLPQLELWTGDWPAAEAAARRHLEIAESSGQESQRRQAVYNLANTLVHQGRESEARPLISDVLALAAADGDAWTSMIVLPVLGLLEVSLGNWDQAVGPLLETGQHRARSGMDGPGRHEPALIETLVTLGRMDDARVALDAFRRRVTPEARPSASAGYHRARALVAAADGRIDEAVAAVDEAMTYHAQAGIAFETAWTLLVRGRLLRRRRERAEARRAFEAAHETFARLGARRFADRAVEELARTGIRTASRQLTETELQVARLVASGMTNREVAAAMFISAKTVDANLGRVYRKLGIASRAELGARMQSLQR